MKTRPWTFITDHGRILVYLAKHQRATAREMAEEASLSERGVQKIIHDLVAEGYIEPERQGRGNAYHLHPELPMRHCLEREHAVGELLNAMGCDLDDTAVPSQGR
jgi:predicted ArsR family transcriptional regulator